jgi:choline dehydrogenase-like flavoprotein
MTAPDADVVVVGSGPAGVSAAWPLVEAGLRVILLDASEPEAGPGLAPARHRADPDHWKTRFGADLAAVEAPPDVSPKFGTPRARAARAGFPDRIGLSTAGFFAAGSLGRGGLSTIWGALATPFTAAERAGLPFPAAELDAAYARVSRRIGLGRPAPPSSPAARFVLARHAARPGRDSVRLEPAPNAVLDAPRDGRQACNLCGLCLYGCDRGSIYASDLELPALTRRPNVSYRPGHLVRAVEADGAGHRLRVETRGGAVTVTAPRVVLAAGTIATTGLALARLGLFGQPVRLLSNPAAAAAFLVPRLVGIDRPAGGLGLGQVFYRAGDAAGVLYGADTLPLDMLAGRLPVGRPFALRVARALAPALLLATCYRPGAQSRNTLTVSREDGSTRLSIRGERTAEATASLTADLSRLGRALRRAGALALPGSTAILEPGADAHYAGTLPMGGGMGGGTGGNGPAATTAEGELAGAPGLYIADGAALPTLPATHPTLTIMANADRIGRALARRACESDDPR